MPDLFNPEWVWETFCQRIERPETDPHQIRIRQFSHSMGRSATISYEVEWLPDDYLPSQHFTVKIGRGKPAEVFQYPDDPLLPGLAEAANPETALRLLNRHVLAIPPRRAMRVEMVRYRPVSRAVLRHSVDRARFYVRVMRPGAISPLLEAQELIGQSGFVVPRLAGCWMEGGVVWLSEIPGKNLRRQIRRGRMPDPATLLDGLQTLWELPHGTDRGRPFNLRGAYDRARRSFNQNLRDNDAALRSLNDAAMPLDRFIKSWRPTGMAHNDFYDDQMLELPDGRIALVDFEEAGPGDPMLDVGNFLAHLRWASCFRRKRETDASGEFYQVFRNAALERFRWSERDVAFREAVCLFRICTNVIRHPQEDWRSRLEAGLTLVNETLG